MQSFATAALLFAAVSAELIPLDGADVGGAVENLVEMIEDEEFDEEYFPTTEEEVRQVLRNTQLEWLLSIDEDAFAFGTKYWDKQAFDSFIVQTNFWLVEEDMYVNDWVADELGDMFGPADDFEFTDLGDYIETIDNIFEDLTDTYWFDSVLSDPFYELSYSQLEEVAEILSNYDITVAVEDLSEGQDAFLEAVRDQGIYTVDDLTQDKLCNILDENEVIDLRDIDYDGCYQITPESVWSKLSTMMLEENDIDLADMGYRSFDDVTEQNIFNTVSSMMDQPMSNYDVYRFDDLTADKLIQILEANGGEVSYEQQQQLKENFDGIQSGAQALRDQSSATLVATGLVEDRPTNSNYNYNYSNGSSNNYSNNQSYNSNYDAAYTLTPEMAAGLVDPINNDGAYTVMASMAAIATAVVALAF